MPRRAVVFLFGMIQLVTTLSQSRRLLKNFVIRGSDLGIFIVGGPPTINNVTVVDNEFGVAAHAAGEAAGTYMAYEIDY